MYKVKSTTKIIEVMTLDDAMKSAKEMNELVTIEGHGIEIIGLFGVDFVLEGRTQPTQRSAWNIRHY